ncbi:4-hydroxy-tetrahydrodipicolinate synthase [Acrocarpospora macrocephala]|uniref:4-hydroxy-tetrahydrodipicolinate synthase n=1 Tax=Acrocarpospora macrocephala TaxID=150177 RepID=A0A5M3X9Z4_9ACTN|nr:dihydrodipicolinate synthase family protein [Acrocarpospora macrocephala]GES15663.1 4-hydroxy-tetrahydrodipicolinate synthase [Acrocarpospora macrocephala]
MQPTTIWGGIFPAALTMFDAHGRLDEDASAAHVDWLIGQGAHGVVVAGTSGEFISLSGRERRRLFEVTVKAAAGRVPVIAGTGAFSTTETVELTQGAAEAGASGAIVILPYYQRPHRDEVLAHFRAVGRAAEIPIMVYNNPANSGTEPLTAADLATLYVEGAAQAVKSTFPTVHQVHEARAATDEGFRVFYGSFMAPLEGMAGGAHGWVSGILNVATPDAVALWEAVQRGDLPAARAAWARILPIKYLYTRQPLGPVSDLAIYREMLAMRGLPGGHSRAPLLPLTSDQRETLARLLAES